MPDTTPHGPDGFPLCVRCEHQIRSANENYPGYCAECIDKGEAGERVEPERESTAASDAHGDTQHARFR
jgi:hypothetical protein